MKNKLLFLLLLSVGVASGCSNDNAVNVPENDVLESTPVDEEGVDYGMGHYTEENIGSAEDHEIVSESSVPSMPSEYTEARFEELKELATVNDIEAQKLLDEMFTITSDLANQGNAAAQNLLGVMYDKEIDETIHWNDSHALAREWFHKSADQGNTSALNTLGEMYFQGASVKQSYPTAMKWFKKSCDNGDENGCLRYETVAGWAR